MKHVVMNQPNKPTDRYVLRHREQDGSFETRWIDWARLVLILFVIALTVGVIAFLIAAI